MGRQGLRCCTWQGCGKRSLELALVRSEVKIAELAVDAASNWYKARAAYRAGAGIARARVFREVGNVLAAQIPAASVDVALLKGAHYGWAAGGAVAQEVASSSVTPFQLAKNIASFLPGLGTLVDIYDAADACLFSLAR